MQTSSYQRMEIWRINNSGGVDKQLLKQTATKLTTTGEMLSSSLDSIRPPHSQSRFYLIADAGILSAYDVAKDASTIKLASTSSAGYDGANFKISWDSKAGESYQIQKSVNLTDWIDDGIPITGNGDLMNYAIPFSGQKLFMRIQLK